MATIVLSAAAQVATSAISSTLFASGGSRKREGARLEELSVQTSTYGEFIPIVYGRARIAGNVIWARPMKEVASTTTTSQGKGGGGASASSTEYSYFATLAIAICEGVVDSLERVWADAKQLDVSQGTYRFYRGGEEQLPDPLIESFEGIGSTPAYRGLCYLVLEDFPLADYGNRIPNFTFEVKRSVLWEDIGSQPVEHLIKEMVLIPGSGEFVYDTTAQEKLLGNDASGSFAQAGLRTPINQHTGQGKANALVALDQLHEACPNVEWVALVINWFGTSMDLPSCSILPAVEYEGGTGTTAPDIWSVGGYSRANAHVMTYVDGSPRYGGTPDDQSLRRLCDELIARGKKILCLPMFLMDVDEKPWRGRLTGDAVDVPYFFTKTNGYNAFVVHYANLLADKIDAIAVGSELVGLTSVHNGASVHRSFPAVNALVSLAATVKGIVGAGIKVTYAADWSEYHHADGGWYNLDPLWASPNIDVIGIDAYFPLTNAPQNEVGYDSEAIAAGWESGEGFEWYYSDVARTVQTPLEAKYAWKNIAWFWSHTHINPDGNSTPWVPESKKIWFTEYGFPSVDGATNQPNVFYDPSSSESYFPRFSQGRIDFRAQRAGIAATLRQWKDSAMLERMFLWTWDARPYPYWPDLQSIWADGRVWITGHWVQGKLGMSSLSAIVADICLRAGLSLNYVDVARLSEQVDGMVIKRQFTGRNLIEMLMDAYWFDASETDGQLSFMPRGSASVASIAWDEVAVSDDSSPLEMERMQELDLPQRVEVSFLNRLSLYQTHTQLAQREVTDAAQSELLQLPIVMDAQRAKAIAEISLHTRWLERTRYRFDVPTKYAQLEPADVVTLTDANGTQHSMRIVSVRTSKAGRLRLEAVADDVAVYDAANWLQAGALSGVANNAQPVLSLTETQLLLLDIPALPNDAEHEPVLRAAMLGTGAGWGGAALYRSDDGGASYGELLRTSQAAIVGTVVSTLGAGARNRIDEASELHVVLMGAGELSSVSDLALLNGANAALVGDEVMQFRSAELTAPNTYRLSGLLRGRLGTEEAIAGHSSGERFVLLQGAIAKVPMSEGLIGLPRLYKAATIGQTLGSVVSQSFTYRAKALLPYAPVHVHANRDGSGNMTLRWVRRTRYAGHWRDGGDVPLGEKSEAYVVEILDAGDVVRVLEVTQPEATYSSAQQIADFGAAQASLSVRVMQLSESVGRGEATEAVV